VRCVGRWWFAPAPAARLGALRLLVGLFSLWYLGRRRRMIVQIARTDPKLYAPVGLARPLKRPLPPPVVRATVDATLAANVAFVAGAGHRVTGPAYASLLLWTLSYRNSWSMVFHNDNLLVLHAVALGCSRAADALAVDARRRPPPAPHPRYGWPIQLMRTVTTLPYLLAGVAKVAGPLGWRWASGESLRRHVAVDGLRKELLGDGAAPAAFALYRHVGLFRALAVGSLAVELLGPAALPSRRASRAWALNALAMHWGILAVMGIRFRYQLAGVAFAPFFPVERPLEAVGWAR
jgi:hypothetical protein